MAETAAIRRLLCSSLNELFPSEIHSAHWQPDDAGQYCPRCGASGGPGATGPRGCPFCTDKPVAWQRIIRLGQYDQPLGQHIRAMKFAGSWRWAVHFGSLLAKQIGRPFDPARIVVCPVPMHWVRRWQRGYNQAQLIAQALAKAHGWPMASTLRRVRHCPPQTAVPVSRRAQNIRGSFAIDNINLTGYEVILVDDVKTTGATLAACTRLLRQRGATTITAAVAAVADPHHHDFTAI